MAVANFIPAVWHAMILENFKERAIIGNTVAREYEGTAAKGNTVHITSFDTPTVIDYAVGNGSEARTAVPEQLNDSSQALNIDQEKAFSFYVDDIDKRQAAGSFAPVVADASAALVEAAESHMAGLLTANGTAINDGSAVDTGNAAFDLVMDMRTALSAAKIPAGNRTLLVNPEFSRLLLGADSKLTEVDRSGSPEGLRQATIGALLGFSVAESALLNPGTATAVAYHRSAMGHVMQLDKVEAIRAWDRFSDIMRGLAVYGSKVLRPGAVQVWIAPAA